MGARDPAPGEPRPAPEPDETAAGRASGPPREGSADPPGDAPRGGVIPVGPHVIPLPSAARAALERAGAAPTAIVATRVWIERRGDGLYLHLGDVEASAPGA